MNARFGHDEAGDAIGTCLSVKLWVERETGVCLAEVARVEHADLWANPAHAVEQADSETRKDQYEFITRSLSRNKTITGGSGF